MCNVLTVWLKESVIGCVNIYEYMIDLVFDSKKNLDLLDQQTLSVAVINISTRVTSQR